MEPEITPDNEGDSRDTLILQSCQPLRKSLAASAPSPLVERDHFPALFVMAQQGFRLEPKNPLGIIFAAAGHWTQRCVFTGPSTLHPFAIGLDLRFVGACRNPSEPCDPNPHVAGLSWIPSESAPSLGASPHSPSRP